MLREAVKRNLTSEQRQMLRERWRLVAAAIVRLRAQRKSDLDALARRYGTDKSSQYHGYTRLYQRHFRTRRVAVRSVLEIGVGGITSFEGFETTAGGQSLRMWRDYFPNAEIVGVDINEKDVRDRRIHFERGDQSDSAFLQEVVRKYGPFDVVIDDGSHIGRHIQASYAALWRAVKPGGMYVIEDLPVAYHPSYEGGPPRTPRTAVELIKAQVDNTVRRYEETIGVVSFEPPVAAIHLYPEMVFFEKSASDQC
jgi:predicted O-methyltransferase YrrM